jgi:hypothetical protein
MTCFEGICSGPASTEICCFECSQYESCNPHLRCDDKDGYEAKTCGGIADDDTTV